MKFSEMPYSRVDFPAVIAQGKEIIQRASQAKSGEEQFELHQEFNKLMDHVKTLYTIAYIRRDGDVTDEFYDGEKSYYDEKLPELNAVTNEYTKVLFATPYRQYMEEKIGPVAFKSMELEMKSFNESLIPLMQEENALASRYSKLIASAKIMWEGEELNLSLMRKYMRSSDRDTRKKAWDAFSEFFEKNQPEIDEIYDLMVKNRTKQAQMLGFENYIDMGYCRMNRNSYTKEDIQKLRDQIKTVFVPLAAKMHKNRQARLGVEALRYYDMGVYFPDTDPAYKGIDSKILLKKVIDMIENKGFVIGNIDCVICLQRPKIKMRTLEMRECLSEIMGIDVDEITIKATTTEKLGFEGREEGVSAYVTVLIIKL